MRKKNLLGSLESQISYWRDNKIKLYTKNLSPACKTCFQGKSIDVNINHICSRACFYCPVPTKKDWDPYLALDHINLKTPQDLIDFVSKFDIETVSFSGGDPMLTFDLLLKYVGDLKAAFGKTVYALIYTNGDGLTEKRAQLLGKAGLDEIRINLSARNYDFAPVILSKKYSPRVAISSPAVPEEYEKMKEALGKMDTAGVDNLNIIELMVAPYNKQALAQRNYTVKLYNAVAESEIAAYQLIKHAIHKQVQTLVHFCTASYKARSCRMGRNLRYAGYARGAGESVTKVGKIRVFSLPVKGNELLLSWLKSSQPGSRWALGGKGELYLAAGLLDRVRKKFGLHGKKELAYYDTYVAPITAGWKGKKIKVNKRLLMAPVRKLSGKVRLKDDLDMDIYTGLFIRARSLMPLVKFLSRRYPEKSEAKLAERIYTLHEKLKDQEYFGDPATLRLRK